MSVDYTPHEVEWTPEKVGRLWDYYASSPAYRSFFFSAHSGRAIAERAERDLGLKGKRVLDFGCGRGDLLEHLLALDVPAQGLEFAPEAAQVVADRLGADPRFQGVVVAEELPSPLADGSFDVVFLLEVVEHLLTEQIEPTIREVARILSSGGHVVVTAPNAEELGTEQVHCPDCGATFHRWQHQRSLTPESVAVLFAPHGFETTTAEALDWTRRPLRTRVLHPRGFGRPHLLYVGVKPGVQ